MSTAAYEPAILSEAKHQRKPTANRINSLKSTGPKSAEGKAASSQNNFRHGFRGKFKLFASEDHTAYDELLESLREEHQPSGVTEDLIVQRMAEHFWLTRRAESFQYQSAELLSEGACGTKDFTEAMALWTRYETTHERAFFKCLNELNKLKAEGRKQERQDRIGFERQKQVEANEKRKQEIHEARLRTAKRTDRDAKTEQASVSDPRTEAKSATGRAATLRTELSPTHTAASHELKANS